MPVFMLRSCPRCQGDFYQERDPFGYFVRCLQCGHEVQLSRGLDPQAEVPPALLEGLRLSADASRLEAEGGGSRPGRRRKFLKVA